MVEGAVEAEVEEMTLTATATERITMIHQIGRVQARGDVVVEVLVLVELVPVLVERRVLGAALGTLGTLGVKRVLAPHQLLLLRVLHILPILLQASPHQTAIVALKRSKRPSSKKDPTVEEYSGRVEGEASMLELVVVISFPGQTVVGREVDRVGMLDPVIVLAMHLPITPILLLLILAIHLPITLPLPTLIRNAAVDC